MLTVPAQQAVVVQGALCGEEPFWRGSQPHGNDA
jgi:hypothetical protein